MAPLRRAGVHTVGQLLDAVHRLAGPGQGRGGGAGPVTRGWRAACEEAADALPAGWRAAAAQAEPAAPSEWLAAIQHLAAWPTAAGDSVRMWQLSVKTATRLQLAAVEEERRQRWRSFAAEVGGNVGIEDVAALFGCAWRLPVANAAKEVVWAMVYDAHMTPQRLGQHGGVCVWVARAGEAPLLLGLPGGGGRSGRVATLSPPQHRPAFT